MPPSLMGSSESVLTMHPPSTRATARPLKRTEVVKRRPRIVSGRHFERGAVLIGSLSREECDEEEEGGEGGQEEQPRGAV